MVDFYRVPKPDENTGDVTLDEWFVAEGEAFKKDQPLCRMIAQKGDFDYLALHDAVLLRQLVTPGSVVPVGYIFAIIGDAGEEIPDASEENAAVLAEYGRELAGGADAPGGGIRATPAARRLARKKNVELAEVKKALGITGAVKPEHIEKYLEG